MIRNLFQPLRVIILVIFIALLGTAGYFFKQYHNTQKQVQDLKKDPERAARLATTELVDKIGKLVVLPEGEDPTIATVTDPEKLKDQAFFAKAKKGDKVLLYTKAKKAFLYDPDLNKVVEIAPINIGDTAASTTTPLTSTTPVSGTTTTTATPTSTKK